GTPTKTIKPDPLSFTEPQPALAQDIAESSKGATVAGDPDSEKSSSFTSFAGSPGGIYQPGWGITNSCRFDTPGACQDAVDHMVPPGFKQEVRLLKKAKENVAKRDQRIHAREEEIKKLDQEVQGLRNQTRNVETLLEAEVDMKKAAEANSVELTRELESLRAKFADLQVNNNQLFQQVSTLQAQVTGEEQIKAAFEEFKKYEDDKVERRCAEMDARLDALSIDFDEELYPHMLTAIAGRQWVIEMDARLDALSIDFDEELYPHMLTAIAGRQWVIEHGLCLAVIKCTESTDLRQTFANVASVGIAKGMSEGLKHGVEHGKAQLDLDVIEAYDPEADTKYVAALHALKDLEYPLTDHLEKLKDALIDLIMASLHLESDVGEETPQWIRELRPSSSQLKIPVYPECQVSVPTVAPQGLAILLTDASSRTETTKDEASPRLIRSKSLPPMYNLDWH
ncbi:hypothetical protein Tco_1481343, partial [Tanacetum coccineum]